MKWSHITLGRIFADIEVFAQGHKVRGDAVVLVALCAVVACAIVWYGVVVATKPRLSSSERTLRVPPAQVIDASPPVLAVPLDSSLADDASQSSSTQAQPSGSRSSVGGHVQVNDVTIPIPSQGEVHKQISSGDSKTNLDISVNSSGSTSGNTSQQSTLNININSETSTNTGTEGEP